MSDKVQITFFCTPAERDLLNLMAGRNKSAFLRQLIHDDAERRGLQAPEDTLEDTRGKYKRNR